MTSIPSISLSSLSQTSGGGFIPQMGAAQVPTDPTVVKAPGSVGLFDGVAKKALISGAIGAGMGFLPFIPGSPILGGVMGAVGGAAMGMLTNWLKMKQIKQQNQATLGALGVQVQDPQVQQILQSGNVTQLLPQQSPVTQSVPVQQAPVTQTVPVQQTPVKVMGTGGVYGAQVVTDPTNGSSQLIDLDSGTVLQDSVAASAANMQALAQIKQTKGAYIPGVGANPGIAPSLIGGGGSAGDAGRPTAPTGVSSSDVTAIAPQAAQAEAAAGVATLTSDSPSSMSAMLDRLQAQIDELRRLISTTAVGASSPAVAS